MIETGTQPNGLNINEESGALYPQNMRAMVLENQADLGIAFDGDGDRVMMMDARGDVKNGDQLLYVIAKSKLANGLLTGGVVGTQMTNLGFEHAMAELDIPFERAAVGDRYVMEKLLERRWFLGGESSGHIICLDKTTTGDGIVAALQVLDWLVHEGLTLTEACADLASYPQTMINVPLPGRINLAETPAIQDAVAAAESRLGNDGRVLLRPSGTEPLIRVMVEGRDATAVETTAASLAEVVQAAVEGG